jgi:hypothetical protein
MTAHLGIVGLIANTSQLSDPSVVDKIIENVHASKKSKK